jgi:hypothetical protein
VQHDPLGGEFNVGSICKAELTVNGHTTQRRRVDVEDHFLACVNGDLVACDGYLAVGPGGRIRPLRRLGRRRSSILGLHDSEYADEKER